MTGNPYRSWVDGFVAALHAGDAIGTVDRGKPRFLAHAPGAPKVLIFSTHPDDAAVRAAGLAAWK